MPSFNWFRRNYNPSDAEAADPDTSAEKAAEDAETGEAETPASSEDYLAWAKAAYQNIQQQQATEQQAAEPPESEPEASAEDALTATEPKDATDLEDTVEVPATVEATAIVEATAATEPAEDVDESAATSAVEPADDDPDAVEEISAEPPDIGTAAEPVAVEAADSAGTEAAEPVAVEAADSAGTEAAETATESEAEPAAAAPFWAQAQAEREARLERLKETAIAEPEPAPEPASEEPDLVLPDIDFDEAFVWSAEVLASQGRRPDQISAEEITWLNRLRQGLGKTRLSLVNQLKSIVGQGPLNADAVDEIEALLLQADVGIEATDTIIESLQARLREETLPPEQAIQYLKTLLRNMLDQPLGETHNLLFVPENDKLNIWMMTGVNGAGKTTTIGKLAHVATKSGYRCLIAAADTFRAAAVEQVKVWGQRSNVDVIANPGQNTDPAAVVYDGISAALSRETELLLVDTAGRLQNKKNLMDELAKIRRIIDKKAPDANVEALLVLDATLGQNGIRQAKVFSEAASLSGVVLTKLDGTAKGGVALAVVQQLGLPIRFIGAGEGIEDLRPFSSYEFVEALLSD
ncbi:MAG: signal recognition particle-docking protein FtsY [Cyanobacteria bacterium P01_D01_bin.14]